MSLQQLDRAAFSRDDDCATIRCERILPGTDAHFRNYFKPVCVQQLDSVNTHDQELIAECLAGCTEAFGKLVVRYQNRLYNTLVKILGSVEDARDVAQDAFVHAFRKLDTFRGQSAFYTWLFRIAFNSAISQQRKRRKPLASIEATFEKAGIEPVDTHPIAEPAYATEVAERQMLVRQGLAQLSEEFRTVLVLKEFEGLKYDEIAELIECPIGTVRSRIHRARIELRQKLEFLFKNET